MLWHARMRMTGSHVSEWAEFVDAEVAESAQRTGAFERGRVEN